MAEVVIVGDSIRMGYQETVEELLYETAQVWWPEENGRHSGIVLENL